MVPCEYCNKEQNGKYATGRFCSDKCARGFATKNKRKEINLKVSKTLTGKYPRKVFEERLCLICKKPFIVNKVEDKKYCSYHCSAKSRKGFTKKFYKREPLSETKKEEIRMAATLRNAEKRKTTPFEKLNEFRQKERLIEENNHKCMQCGQNEEWNGKKLYFEFHHKDGHNNKIRENCEVLCPNCHSQTDNYKFRNKKHSTEELVRMVEGVKKTNLKKKNIELNLVIE